MLHEVFRYALDFILPQSCLICHKEIEGPPVCNDCLDLIPVVSSPRCPVCGRPTRRVRSVHRIPRCRYCRHSTSLDRGRAWTLFVPPLDRIVHHFKYRRGLRLGRLLGLGMALVMRYDPILASSDLIVPVPLYWLKKMRRGYNQAQVLAQVVSRETGIPVCDGLRRIRFTRTQTRLPDRQRIDNVSAAFRLRRGADIAGKKILLVDDVMTTGATIRECARVLKDKGADRVCSLVAAITP